MIVRPFVFAALAAAASSVGAVPPQVHPRDGILDQELAVVWEQVLNEDECLLGQINDAKRGPGGEIFLADFGAGDVKEFAADGRYQRTLSRRGEGPGETEDPNDVVPRGDGQLGIVQRFPARLVWLDLATGDPAGALDLKDADGRPFDIVALLGAVPVGDGLVASLGHMSADENGQWKEAQQVVRLDALGRVLMVYHRQDGGGGDGEDPCTWYRWADRCWTASPDGRVFIAPERDRHLLLAFAADGAPLWSKERAYQLLQSTAKTRARTEAMLRRHGTGFKAPADCDHAAVARFLHWGDRGEVWVRLDLGGAGPVEGSIAWYDVYAADGTYLRQVHWLGDFDYDRDRAFRLDDTSVLVLRIEDDGTQTLRLLALPMSPKGGKPSIVIDGRR